MEQFLIINNKQQLSRWCLPNFSGMLCVIKNTFNHKRSVRIGQSFFHFI